MNDQHIRELKRIKAFADLPYELVTLLREESDRGAILIMGAYLDEVLALIIRGHAHNDSDADDILKYGGPAGEFSARITLCKGLGFIAQEEAKALHLVRKIRNHAAHFDAKSGRGFDVLFDSAATADVVAALLKSLGATMARRDPIGVRFAFLSGGLTLSASLTFRALSAVPKRIPPQLSRLLFTMGPATEENLKLIPSTLFAMLRERVALTGGECEEVIKAATDLISSLNRGLSLMATEINNSTQAADDKQKSTRRKAG